MEIDTEFQIVNMGSSHGKKVKISIEKDAFKETVVLMEAVETFGCSTAICEASFSSFTRIGILGRICMTSERLRNLSFMAFEYKRLNLIDETKILRAVNNSKQGDFLSTAASSLLMLIDADLM